ncbi:MAG: hypothetical protein HQ567_16850, partial [Candidatus Nealsonbacteria bacterium]|nr:hypothetical protein [Candidatus Nealsonbacteria bacterium]
MEINDVLDEDGTSVKGTSLDVKTKIDAPTDPAKIRYRIVGPNQQLTVTNAKIRIYYDDSNDAHEALYGTGSTLVRTLEGSPAPISTNQYELVATSAARHPTSR